ncbi:ATP-dependent nuclease [Pontibacter chitinilyticus]|uniref:ATP-dependent nuclease n=1 Tax=Pontibacter chitinilyticus TaxID=2674989 RepID=UPI0032197495
MYSNHISDLDYDNDFTHWKKKNKDKEEIFVLLEVELNKDTDTGNFKFLKELIFKNEEEFNRSDETLRIEATHSHQHKKTNINVYFGNHLIEDEYKRDELLRRLRGSKSVLFHNSTENHPFFFTRGFSKETLSSYLSHDDADSISKKKLSLENAVTKSLKKHQTDLSGLLGRLQEKYDVSLEINSFKFERENIVISLKEKDIEVPLEEWGSGTRNRTLILMNLMNAKRMQNSGDLTDRITPVVIIEEPESFLHPSAQAEFGRILQDIAIEFKIQIIVATHSPYLLSHKSPKANILLERNFSLPNKGSEVIDTAQEKWYEPFALSLGINGDDLGPLKSTIFSNSNDIILVEGDTDKEYFELLKDSRHGANRLKFEGDIFAYGGAGNLKNNILVRFIKDRFKRFVVTVDLDKYSEVKKTLETLDLKENQEFIIIGKNETGKKCIEGLVPANICKLAYAENADLVQKAMENSDNGKSARNELKSKVLDAFKKEAFGNLNNFSDFYKVVKTLNKAFKG